MIIFYHPETLKVMGASDGQISMEFPYIQTQQEFFSLENIIIVDNGEGKEKSYTFKEGTLISPE